MGFFGVAHGLEGGGIKIPLLKISQTYPSMMALGTAINYLKKIQKFINHVTHPITSNYFNLL